MEHVPIGSLETHRLTRFVVERRLALSDAALLLLSEALADACRRQTARGQSVRYLRSTNLPAERRVLCFFEAVNADAVKTVNLNALAPFVSIKAA